MPAISSLHNDRVKTIHALQSFGKTRRTESRVVLEGTRLIADALESGAQPEYALYTIDSTETDKLGGRLFERLRERGVECVEVTPEVMTHCSDTQTPQGWLAVFPMPKLTAPTVTSLALILDSVADPGNMGTILRTAAAAEVDVVVLAPHCVDPYNPKVLRGGMGAHFRIPMRRLSWADIALTYGSLPIYLTDVHAETPYTAVDWTRPGAIIIGGEAHGADIHAKHISGINISIPMGNAAESLNAAVAAGIILFEARRQRALV